MNNMLIALPFLSAALYGLGYVLVERLLKSASIITFTFCSALTLAAVCGIAGLVRKEGFHFEFVSNPKTMWLFIFAVIANAGGWMVTQFALKHTSAEFVSFAELTYPLFTLMFLFVLFGQSHFNWQTLLGGALVITGAGIMLWGQKSHG